MKFYIYVRSRPDGRPFYVGKGCLQRAWNFKRRNPHHAAILAKHGHENIRVDLIEVRGEAEAFKAERLLIELFTALGHRLANKTEGGEGTAGFTQPAHVGRAVAAANKLRVWTPAAKASIARKSGARERTPETSEKIRKALTGRSRPAHVIEALRVANTGRALSAQHRELAVATLDAHRDRAAAWHSSPEGIAWHAKNGKAAMAKRQRHEGCCAECNGAFTSIWPRTRFCGKRCADRQRHRNSRLRTEV